MTDIGRNACEPQAVRKGFEWLLSFFARADCTQRRRGIETQQFAVARPHAAPIGSDDFRSVSIVDDRIGWHLCLAETLLAPPFLKERAGRGRGSWRPGAGLMQSRCGIRFRGGRWRRERRETCNQRPPISSPRNSLPGLFRPRMAPRVRRSSCRASRHAHQLPTTRSAACSSPGSRRPLPELDLVISPCGRTSSGVRQADHSTNLASPRGSCGSPAARPGRRAGHTDDGAAGRTQTDRSRLL
jgi:hypothetical protein